MKDPTEEELAGAAEKLDTMVAQLQLCPDFFFSPTSFGALTIELQPFQDKMARILYAIAVELWLRKGEADIQRTLDGVARSMTLRLAEHLAQYISYLSCGKQVNWSLLTFNVCSMLGKTDFI